MRDNFGTGVYSVIPGATGTTYVLVDADDTCHIKTRIAGVNAVGSGAPADSNIVGPITQLAPTNTVAPVASGVPIVGNFVSVAVGTWTGMGGFSGAFTYQWQRETGVGTGSYANISGATSGRYTLVQADSGRRLRCNVTGTNDTSSATAVSNVVGPIQDAPAPPDPDDGGTPPPDEHLGAPPTESFAIGVYQKLFPVT
jgi:hypothetical protein